MAFTDTLDCHTAAVNTPVTSSENEFATSVSSRITSRHLSQLASSTWHFMDSVAKQNYFTLHSYNR